MTNNINAFCLMNGKIAELPLEDNDKLKLDKLIEQDKCFSEIGFIDGVSIWEKGKEEICENENGDKSYVRFKFKNELVPEQFGGISFFHELGGKQWHIRIHKGE